MRSRVPTKPFLGGEVAKSGCPPPLPILYNITTDEKKIGKYTVGGKKYKEKYNAFATNSN